MKCETPPHPHLLPQSHISLLPNLGLEGLARGLEKLEVDCERVADADMDAMFAQVRVEERTGARDVLGGIVDQAKGELEGRMAALGGERQRGAQR